MPEQRPAEPVAGHGSFPPGEAVTLADLEADPHPDHPSAPSGLVFSKPPTLRVRWDAPAA